MTPAACHRLTLPALCVWALALPLAAQAQVPADPSDLDALRQRIAAPLMAQPLIGQQPLVPLAQAARLPRSEQPLALK